jgi:hypothetical protein
MDRVVALPIHQHGRNIGLAEDDGTRRLQPRDRHRVKRDAVAFRAGKAPGGDEAGDVEALLHRHRDAEQRPVLAAREHRVRRGGSDARAIEIPHHHGVQLPIQRRDAGDGLVGQLDGGDFAGSERRALVQ